MTYLLAIGSFALGSVLASFIMVVAERLHTGTRWMTGRSSCNSCSRTLGAPDLVPVLSWLASAGRCRSCGCRVPAAYAAGEAALGTLFLLAFLVEGPTLALASLLLALSTLFFVVVYDLRHTIVPPEASSLLVLFSLSYAFLAGGMHELGPALLAAGLTGLGFLLAHALSRGRAMGLGDAPVALALALLVGADRALPGLLFSFWVGGAVGIAILVSRPKGHRMGIEVPFVPFLAAGYLLALFTTWNPLALTP